MTRSSVAPASYADTFANRSEDDIATLMRYLGAHSMTYADVSIARAHQQILKRWQLLAELDAYS